MGINTGGHAPFSKRIDFNSNTPALLTEEQGPRIVFKSDVLQLFAMPALVDFSVKPLSLDPSLTEQSAKQFAAGFSFDHLHN